MRSITAKEIKLVWDGNAICALIGDDLVVGCGGFGESVPAALRDQDRCAWPLAQKNSQRTAAAPRICFMDRVARFTRGSDEAKLDFAGFRRHLPSNGTPALATI
jgi:hypothetical protein